MADTLTPELATCASVLADAYDAQARKLAEVVAERDALKAEKAAAIAVLVDPTNQNGINGDLVACAKDLKQAHIIEAETSELAMQQLDALKAKVEQ